jgi:hypothetical protein
MRPAYYAAKRACAPLLPIIFESKGKIEFFFSNGRPEPVPTAARFGVAHLDETTVWAKVQTLKAGPVGHRTFSRHRPERNRFQTG